MDYEEYVELEDIASTVDYMISSDWKERFIAEYIQLDYRIEKLLNLFWEEDEYNVECPMGILSLQIDKMTEYKQILEIRAEMYGIDLDQEKRKMNEKSKKD